MIVFPNAKINIGLNILRKRPDGYHDIESVFYPVQLRDILEILPLTPDLNDKKSHIYVSGTETIASEENLCVKAVQLFREKQGIPDVRLHLHKKIPIGGGLGGGSSDASFTLLALNEMFGCELKDNILKKYSAELGSDCPFFIGNRPSLVSGRGDILEDIPLNLGGYHLVLVFPGLFVDTSIAYQMIHPSEDGIPLRDVLQLGIEKWKDRIINRFEEAVFSKYPEIGKIKEGLYSSGAVYASMSGSGSAVYGIFHSSPRLTDDLAGFRTHIEKMI
ncbi:4-(cytidine 5'-diphospho)-2-C-methyl-D-erythritol kinase [Bacteroidota bacterium]